MAARAIDPEELEITAQLARNLLIALWGLEKKLDKIFPLPRKEEILRSARNLALQTLGITGVKYFIFTEPKAIACTACSLISYNPTDVSTHYCGHCHRFHDDT